MTRMISDAWPGHEDYRNTINNALRAADSSWEALHAAFFCYPLAGLCRRQTEANYAFMPFVPT